MVRGQCVRYGWIPVIEGAREVLHEEQRIFRLFTETPIGVFFFFVWRNCVGAVIALFDISTFPFLFAGTMGPIYGFTARAELHSAQPGFTRFG